MPIYDSEQLEKFCIHVTNDGDFYLRCRECFNDRLVEIEHDDDLTVLLSVLADHTDEVCAETKAKPVDVWLRIPDGEEEAEAEANTFRTEIGYRVDWYLTAVGLVTSVEFDTYYQAEYWLKEQGFEDYTNNTNGDYREIGGE